MNQTVASSSLVGVSGNMTGSLGGQDHVPGSGVPAVEGDERVGRQRVPARCRIRPGADAVDAQVRRDGAGAGGALARCVANPQDLGRASARVGSTPRPGSSARIGVARRLAALSTTRSSTCSWRSGPTTRPQALRLASPATNASVRSRHPRSGRLPDRHDDRDRDPRRELDSE
jgi:hypothetical protein